MRSFLVVLGLGLVLAAGCKKHSRPERCYVPADCHSDQICARLESGAQTCLDTCDAALDVICEDGASCVGIGVEDASLDVCLPGGTVVVGAECAQSIQCVDGATCIVREGETKPHCERLCTVGSAAVPCLAGQTCVAIDASQPMRGICGVP